MLAASATWPTLPASEVIGENIQAHAEIKLSCRPVLEQNLFDICQFEFPCPGQGSCPRFVIGQVGCGTSLEQELDHLSSGLRLLGVFVAEHVTNGGSQWRFVFFDAAGVDVGARLQKDRRERSVSVLGEEVQKRFAEPVGPVGIESPHQQFADQRKGPRIDQFIRHAINDFGIGVEIKIDQVFVATPHHAAEKIAVAGYLMTVLNGLLHLGYGHFARRRVSPITTQELLDRFPMFAVGDPASFKTVRAIVTRIWVGPSLQQ